MRFRSFIRAPIVKKGIVYLLAIFLGTPIASICAEKSEFYGVGLCDKKEFKCVRVAGSQSWERLFPDERERDLIQKINRTDTRLYHGRILAVPTDIKNTTLEDVSPFPLQIKPTNEKLIIVNQNKIAWGAYNTDGRLVKWGPISSGKDYCPDIGRACKTITGIFYVFHKKGKGCESNIFPVGRGGSNMPYCMFFYKGYALHGSNEVYGYRASHGCVRLFTRDAKWLNEHFVDVLTREGDRGTKVVIENLAPKENGRRKS